MGRQRIVEMVRARTTSRYAKGLSKMDEVEQRTTTTVRREVLSNEHGTRPQSIEPQTCLFPIKEARY